MTEDRRAGLSAATAAMACRIMDYIAQHPLAADTCEGVARWWVGADVAAELQVVQDALDHLVDTGVLQVHRLPSGKPLYFSVPRSGGGNRNKERSER
jgi:hypothetical protein